MLDIPKEKVLERLRLDNPWWRKPHQIPKHFVEVRPRPYIERLFPLVTQRDIRRAVVLMGPRRVGKTYLVHHTIGRLIDEGFEPHNLCYVSIDNPLYLGLSLQTFLELFAEATGDDPSTEAFVFFDEIQYLKDWEQHLKTLVDSYPTLRVVVSGSAAAALRLKSRESGAGRFTDFFLPPLTFYEYLQILGEEPPVDVEIKDDIGIYTATDLEALNRSFEDYVQFGGYPEVATSTEIQENPSRFIKSDIIDKVLLRDLPSLYGISDVQELNALFTSLAFNTAGEVSLEQVTQRSGAAKATIKRYIEYLQAAFMIRIVHRVDESARTFQRVRAFKVYLTNPSLRTALFGPTQDERVFGALVENAILAQWFAAEGLHLHYARWKDGEIDLVNLLGHRVDWAVEVKWSDRHRRSLGLLKGPLDFCAKNNVSTLVTTSRTAQGAETLSNIRIVYWPAALYAYAVSHSQISTNVHQLEVRSPESL
ncbi:MAG: ATP-binding protein [Acidobacteriota bacterium]